MRSRLTPSERGRILHRLGDLIAENTDELAELESLDNGKAKTVAAGADVPLAADLFWYMAGWATRLKGSTVTPSLPYIPGGEFLAYTLKEPVGVVGQIIPWNFPAADGGVEGRPGTDLWQHRRAEARRADAADGDPAGRARSRRASPTAS